MVASLLQGVDVHIGKCPSLGKGFSLDCGRGGRRCYANSMTRAVKRITQRSIAQCTKSSLPDAAVPILCNTSTIRSAGSDCIGRPDMRRIYAAVGDQGW